MCIIWLNPSPTDIFENISESVKKEKFQAKPDTLQVFHVGLHKSTSSESPEKDR